MKSRTAVKGLLFLPLCLTLHAAGGEVNVENSATIAPDFAKMSYEAGSNIVDVITKAKPKPTPEYVEALVKQIRDEGVPNYGRVFAIYLLGSLRVTNSSALAVLIDYIDLKAERLDIGTRIRRWSMYPAVDALTRIGAPAAEAVLARLASEDTPVRRWLMVCVVKAVQGAELGSQRITLLLKAESVPSKRANLNLALTALKALP